MGHLPSDKIPGVFIPDEIWYAEDLKPIDVRILGELRRLPREDDGSIHARARRIALKANCDTKTVAARIRLMADNGWLRIKEVTEGGGGGFRLEFVRAALIAFLMLTVPALHKLAQQDTSTSETPAHSLLSDKRRNGRRKRVRDHYTAAELELYNMRHAPVSQHSRSAA